MRGVCGRKAPVKKTMDALSSSNFQPLQQDGFVLGSPGRETPKIEITETDPLCHSPLSHPTGCDVGLSEWDDFHLHGDGTGAVDYLVERPSSPQHQDPCDPRGGGGGSRRAEGGGGKCPSPSRSSPRRHSPVPYSPKRQHRGPRTSATSVASEELAEVSPGPRGHSPVAFLPGERPCSLPLASAASEEFICVSYSDPFSSPSITRTSEGILAISLSCSREAGMDQDVEMTPNDAGYVAPASGGGVDDVQQSGWDFRRSSATGDRAAVDGASLAKADGLFRATVDEPAAQNGELHHVGELDDADSLCRKDSAAFTACAATSGDWNLPRSVTFSESDTPQGSPRLALGADSAEPGGGNPDTGQGTVETESMEGDEFCPEGASSSDSSSDDDGMEDLLAMSQPAAVPGPLAFAPLAEDSTAAARAGVCASPQSAVLTTTAADSSRLQHQDSAMIATDSVSTFHDSDACSHIAPSAPLGVVTEQSPQSSADVEPRGQQRPHEAACSPCFLASSVMPSRRASYPTQQTGASSSLLSPCSLLQTSPRRNTCGRVSKTPDDFSLPRVVGHPPLHFPHGQDAMLVHCALPSPYDPDLPTPPIVLTPHTSYDDLNVDFSDKMLIADGGGQPGGVSRTWGRDRGEAAGGGEVEEEEAARQGGGGAWGPDIARSRSFPNLHREDRFREPHQMWPVLGDSGQQDDEGRGPRRSSWGHEEEGSLGGVATTTTSGGPPGSPCSLRAAVMGRLRRVVERRLSATGRDSQAPLEDG